MLLSHRHRFIFVHIPKCAGTSVAHSLKPLSDWPVHLLGYSPLYERYQARFQKLNKHMMAHRVRQVVGEQVWRDYFTFAFVRHPLARAVSYYTWVAKIVENARLTGWLPARLRVRSDTYKFPVTRAYLETADFSEFIRHPGFVNDHGCRPQVDFINDLEAGGVILDYVGKVESLADDLRLIGERLVGRPLVPREANVSRNRANTANYFQNQDDVNYLCELYSRDFEQLGYPRQLP